MFWCVYKKLNEFRLIFHLICVDCQQEENFHFLHYQINFSHRTCQGCKNFSILKSYSSVNKSEEFKMGSVLSKKSKVEIKSLVPKDSEIFQTSGEITLRKDTDFDIFCFEIKFNGYFQTQVRLWPENYRNASPTPEVGSVSYVDSGFDCQ